MFPVGKPLPRPPGATSTSSPSLPSKIHYSQQDITPPSIPNQRSSSPSLPPIPSQTSALPPVPQRTSEYFSVSKTLPRPPTSPKTPIKAPTWSQQTKKSKRDTKFSIGTARQRSERSLSRQVPSPPENDEQGMSPQHAEILDEVPPYEAHHSDESPKTVNEDISVPSLVGPVPNRASKPLSMSMDNMPLIPPPTPPKLDNEDLSTNENTQEVQPTLPPETSLPKLGKEAPVFRGNWNPSVPAPRPGASFIPTFPSVPTSKPKQTFDDETNDTDMSVNSIVEEQENNEDELQRLAALRVVYQNVAPPPPSPSDSDEEPPPYGIDSDEDVEILSSDDEPPPYMESDEEDDDLPPPYGYNSDDEEIDEAEMLALIEAEMEEDDENTGNDSLEECKMMIQWGAPGDPPPVPSRDDPSHYLSEEKALQFIHQKEEVPDAYRAIKEDPRYQRLRLKWCPDIFTKEGAVQFAKNKVDPATLPYVGILFHMNRVKDAKQGHSKVQKLKENATPELQSSMDTFSGALVTRAVQETAYTGVAAACMALPVVDFIPGLSAQLMILGEVGAGVAESGVEMGLKVIISKGTGQLTSTAMARTDAFGGFGSSKAFLLYIGLPKTDDPLYAEWEPHRLKLKALYGCAPEDDLMKMRPKGQLLKQIREEEKKSGKPYQVEVPLLVLLYRAFDCWHELYWDRFVYAKESAKGKTRSVLGLRRELTLEERRRMRDYRKLQETAAVIESKAAIDPHLQILRKDKKKEIIQLLTKSLLHSYHVAFLFTRKKTRAEQKKNLEWFMKMVVDYFFAHNAFFWGYVGTDKKLKAVAIWDHPNEAGKISFLSMLRTNGALKLGPNRWKNMSDILFRMEEIRKSDIKGLRCWMLHWIAVDPCIQKQGIGELLVKNTISRHSEPIYIQLFDIETEMVTFLNKLCFVPVRHEDARFQLYGKNVSVVAYWFGMQSPTELRALLPAKKKNPLQLTYSTIRKAASLQSLPGRMATEQLRIQNEQVFAASEENKLYQEAKQRYEETATLLDHLKMDLAMLPTADRDNNPVAQCLEAKIEEYQHLLDIHKRSLEDAKNNANAIKSPLMLTN